MSAAFGRPRSTLVGLGLAAALLAAAPAALLAAAPAASSPVVEYLYVEANEGGSTGGHVALRLGERVFHFQHQPPGIVAIGRVGYRHFRHQYGDLENRSIHAVPMAASDAAGARLLDRLLERLTVQDRQLAAGDALHRDRSTLEAMREARVSIEGAGLFFLDDESAWSRADRGGEVASLDPPAGEPAILALRRKIDAARGPEFLADRRELIRRRLDSLDPEALELPAETLSADRVPRPTYGFPQRYADVAAGLLALEVVSTARPLRVGALAASGLDGELALGPADLEAVRALATALEDSLVALIASERPDWGPAALLGMARLAALRRTEAEGRWVVVDALVPGVPARWRPSERPDIAAAQLRDAREAFAEARHGLVAESRMPGAFPELEIVALEAAVGRLVELQHASAVDRPLRHLSHAVRTRPAHVGLPGPVSSEALARGIVRVTSREASFARELRQLYGYNVVTRNCVTEILNELEAALVPIGSTGDATRALAFIPAVSASFVRELYGTADAVEIPSYRKRELARMREGERGAGVLLRESNTITSTVYRRNPQDSVFLFFTDHTIAARPLLGVANALVGLVASLAGLAMLPADGGDVLVGGLRGLLFSLPELAFQNIRKGSFDYVPRPR